MSGIIGKKKISLTPDSILSKVSEYDIFRWYHPGNWKLNQATNSPFRKDNNPSFLIGTKRGIISYIDFGDTSKRGNCFDFVKQLYNLSTFDDVLLMIDRDMGLGIVSNNGNTGAYKIARAKYEQPEKESKLYTSIQVVTRKFTEEELAYWNQYHQDISDLKANNIYSIKEIYLNKQKFLFSPTDLRFGYLYEGRWWKIYFPFKGKKFKWLPNNVPITCMDGKEDIKNCDVALISKSKKDYMTIKKVFPCSCAVQNEGAGCFSDENVEYLKANSNRQILSFDSDETGVTNSQQITQKFGFDYCNVPRKYLSEGIKDFADLGRIHGLKEIEKVLKEKQIL